ncbi:MAG: extracellular solute-binding protein, partial [Burkholderiales bacterium]|nr:extracellular solute-binding protein [Anaerolineae bacterium]
MKLPLVLVLTSILSFSPTAAQHRPFEGVRIIVATQTGAAINGPIETFRGEWEAATGGTVDVQSIPFDSLHERILNSFENGSNEFDVIFYVPQWAGDFMNPGYVVPIPDDIKARIDWDDILPVYREQLTAWGGVIYALPFSGDALLLNYRKDLVNPQSIYAADFRSEYGYTLDEPQTWDQYHEIAAFFNRREVETSGVIALTFGAAEAQAPNAQATASLIARAASFTKRRDDPCFFFSCDPDSPMQPKIHNTGWVHALADMGDIQNYSSPAITSFGVE